MRGGHKPTVLVVNDNADTRVAVRWILKGWGGRVLEAADGRQAFGITVEYRPDLILMDLSMPVVDGLDAVRSIRGREEFSRLPIIAVTAFAAVVTLLAAGAGFGPGAPRAASVEGETRDLGPSGLTLRVGRARVGGQYLTDAAYLRRSLRAQPIIIIADRPDRRHRFGDRTGVTMMIDIGYDVGRCSRHCPSPPFIPCPRRPLGIGGVV